jgi:ATP/maltotriose-dependent transcriptional regulator MalT
MNAEVELERGRESYAERAWNRAYRYLSAADRELPLAPSDLESLATSAYMLGRDDEYVDALGRAHDGHVVAGDVPRAVRCAFWAGLNLLLRAEPAHANGWFGRAERLLDREEGDCAERGYLLVPAILEKVARGDNRAAYAVAEEAARIGERFRDSDLLALVLQEQAHALVRQGRREAGLRLLDAIMVEVISGALSPIVSGLIYCNTITFCQSVYEHRRAREWTDALTRWCDEQPDMVAHTGACLVHRAEILERAGAWTQALDEARRARERFLQGSSDQAAAGHAFYREGEVLRLRGEHEGAERAYREASRIGWEPQPGVALLRLAQGRLEAAAGAMRRLVAETPERYGRLQLLPAYVEILLAVGDIEAGGEACRELDEASANEDSSALKAMAGYARGAYELAAGEPERGLAAARRSFRLWRELDVPYEAARARVLIALACRALDDEDTASRELDDARTVFAELGAATDLARLETNESGEVAIDHGLTERELEVLRLVAVGQSNRQIASELVISEHTVARHLQNIFAKLRVSSRTAAGAFAFEHELV